MKIKILFCLSVILISIACVVDAQAEGKSKHSRAVQNTNGTPVLTYLNINNISTVLRNDGTADIDAQEQNSGLVFPKGSRKTAAFQTGFLWGGKINGLVRVGGSSYRTGLQPGKILSPGVAEDPALPKNRIYRVRRDVYPGGPTVNLSSETNDEGGSAAGIRTQYETDWTEWPAGDGAPFEDKDSNGIYNPAIDIPGVAGADQTIWFVCNDENSGATSQLYGSSPMDMEMQVTIWGYSQQGALGNMFFKKYLLIHKGTDPITDMYVSQWSDVDLGNSTDDYAGCDTTLSLGYIYNANATDATYAPLPPPVTGFDFFQGPLVSSLGSTGRTGGHLVADKKNLPMTAFYYFARGDATVTDPVQGSQSEGAERFYNFFQGKIGLTGQPFTDPNTGLTTPFALAGDPQTGKGWLDGQLLPAGDRRLGLASGPFTMSPGDTQEVVVAEMCAGAIPGTDRLSAIGLLKFYDLQAQLAYDNFFDLPIPPPAPTLTATELDREILLSWGNDLAAVKATEGSPAKGYNFEGYNVYQLPSKSATITEAKRVATFDIVNGVGKIKDLFFDPGKGDVLTTVVQFGNDVGIQRYINITSDAIKGGTPLINGIRYYFAVTAYSYNSDPTAVPNNLENPLAIITVVPHSNNPGVRLSSSFGGKPDSIVHSTGIANASVQVNVVDPSKLTGADYTVGWSTQPDNFAAQYLPPDSALTIGPVTMEGSAVLNEAGTELSYNVRITNIDSLTGPVTAAHFHNGAVDTVGPVVRDIAFTTATVLGKQIGTATGVWKATDGQPLTPALVQELIAGRIYVNVHTATNPTGEIRMQFALTSYPWYLDRGTTRLLSYQQNYSLDNAYATVDGLQVKVGNLQFAAPVTYFSATQTVDVDAGDNSITLFGDGLNIFGNATGLARDNYGAGGEQTTLTDLVQDLEFRFTGVPSDPLNPLESTIASGGSIATIRSRSDGTAIARVRIPFELWEVERNRQINVTIVDRNAGGGSPWGDTGTPLWYRIRGRDYIIPIATPYDSSTNVSAIKTRTDPYTTWFVFFDGGENGNASTWDTGDQFRIVYANPIVPGTDTYTFKGPEKSSYSADQARKDIEKINVFPNPYYAVNTEEINKYQKFVTFTHLPDNATIRIFNLAGILVRTIHKNITGQYQRWDLSNESGLPAASGLYIAYIDMPDIGTTKVVKFSIIQERQFLDRF